MTTPGTALPARPNTFGAIGGEFSFMADTNLQQATAHFTEGFRIGSATGLEIEPSISIHTSPAVGNFGLGMGIAGPILPALPELKLGLAYQLAFPMDAHANRSPIHGAQVSLDYRPLLSKIDPNGFDYYDHGAIFQGVGFGVYAGTDSQLLSSGDVPIYGGVQLHLVDGVLRSDANRAAVVKFVADRQDAI